MRIRKFEKNDLPQVLELCREVRQHHIDFLGGYFTPQDDKEEQNNLLLYLDNENHIALVAFEDEYIYGFLLAEIKNASYLEGSKVAHVGNFGVAKTQRRRGIGKMLMDSFMEICYSKEIDEVRLGVFNNNAGAYKFYEQYGFKPFEQRMQIMLNNNKRI